ncbi:hypothetical protein CDAR_213161 [Caerostris darwini]|uniref:Uncharacterized protein n=1 Tax=Caerostris darwini TaxID=1538125 RepID=A0AAV4PYN8_9ARAC|nr:hypothetical protein CDAR_213161 [Caerostris darwini]
MCNNNGNMISRHFCLRQALHGGTSALGKPYIIPPLTGAKGVLALTSKKPKLLATVLEINLSLIIVVTRVFSKTTCNDLQLIDIFEIHQNRICHLV